MDSAFRRSILDFLVSSADLLNFSKRTGRTCVAKHADNEACIQFHKSAWLGNHYDWRFSRGGVLKCFSTRQIPAVKQTVVALQEVDRPLSYLYFSGTIPREEVEAGQVWLVDMMRLHIVTWSDEEIRVDLTGSTITGQFLLFRTEGGKFMMVRSR